MLLVLFTNAVILKLLIKFYFVITLGACYRYVTLYYFCLYSIYIYYTTGVSEYVEK